MDPSRLQFMPDLMAAEVVQSEQSFVFVASLSHLDSKSANNWLGFNCGYKV